MTILIEKGKTPKSKIEYELYKINSRGFEVDLYTPMLPKSAPFIFYGDIEECKKFIAER